MAKPLKLTSTPNFKDPRNQRRALRVLAWAEEKLVGYKHGRSVSSGEIRTVFSNKDQPGPAQWLFANLMQLTDTFQPGKRNNKYRIKRRGLEKIYKALGVKAPSDVEILRRKYADVLEGTALEYRDSGLRRYHEIQNIKRDLRKAMFEGWWDYDIEACAPTLIHQYAVAYYRKQHGSLPEPFPAVARLVRDKMAVRQYVAELTGLDAQPTKELLTMLFFRANTAPFHENRLFSIFDGDPARLTHFLEDPFIRDFRSDVERMWEAAIAYDDDERRASGCRQSQIKRKSKRRMNVYLKLERRVMDVILNQLMIDGVVPILMHDGFMLRTKTKVNELVLAVRNETGFEIRLSEVMLMGASEMNVDPDPVEQMRDALAVDDV